ncbi:four helix bundle protein [Lutibacter sp. Hel_I_33_5]|uniref:four helix bundle protein n=1 Tax=Lutibacter sp. Hel_I_33_5 TaxID=1566289 RepID=UPI0011A0F749|nr:four helix bundle protein [Lutibacter sp. Hel_I_33_5]TVZ56457.1 four helix bundle protein [Lutibacter sp. Hel_I_33_5]
MGSISTYKDLLIWQKGIQIVKEVYLICKEIPKDELYGLQSQIKRSSVSIPSNIAEGWGRNYTKSYIKFLKYSRGSLLELETQIIIAKELEFISIESFNKIQNLITEESKMLNAFIKSVDK